jgi:hypothetical protein
LLEPAGKHPYFLGRCWRRSGYDLKQAARTMGKRLKAVTALEPA